LSILESYISRDRSKISKYVIILLSPPRSKTVYNSSARYIRNFGLLVKTE